MNQGEDSEEGVLNAKTTHHHTKTLRSPEQQRAPQSTAPEPEPERRLELSTVSCRSNSLKDIFYAFQQRQSDRRRRLEEPEPSCVSLKSDSSMPRFILFKNGLHGDEQGIKQGSSEIPNGVTSQHQTLDPIFEVLKEKLVTFTTTELERLKNHLDSGFAETSVNEEEDEEVMSNREALLKIILYFLKKMDQEQLVDCLQSRSSYKVCQHTLKSSLKGKFQCVTEGTADAGNPTFLNDIYTELHVTEGGTGEVNEEHEVRQIEMASRRPDRRETTIKCEDIFKPFPGRDLPIRMVISKGVAGIGKTVLTQKFALDWAEDKANQDIDFTFPFTFRELNLLRGKKYSLVELVHHFFAATKQAGVCRFEDLRVVFIFDGLDECRLPLNFHSNETVTDVTESTSVDVLLTNLIRGNLLPSARLWITTRPAAASRIPAECVDMVTEIRGFTNPQKQEYFRKRFQDEEQASRIIFHIKAL